MKNDKKKNIKIWGEHIDLKKMLLGLTLSIGLLLLTMIIFMIIGIDKKEIKLTVGLLAILIGFILNAIFIKPRRILETKKESRN